MSPPKLKIRSRTVPRTVFKLFTRHLFTGRKIYSFSSEFLLFVTLQGEDKSVDGKCGDLRHQEARDLNWEKTKSLTRKIRATLSDVVERTYTADVKFCLAYLYCVISRTRGWGRFFFRRNIVFEESDHPLKIRG